MPFWVFEKPISIPPSAVVVLNQSDKENICGLLRRRKNKGGNWKLDSVRIFSGRTGAAVEGERASISISSGVRIRTVRFI
jgi:hypothetical protein